MGCTPPLKFPRFDTKSGGKRLNIGTGEYLVPKSVKVPNFIIPFPNKGRYIIYYDHICNNTRDRAEIPHILGDIIST